MYGGQFALRKLSALALDELQERLCKADDCQTLLAPAGSGRGSSTASTGQSLQRSSRAVKISGRDGKLGTSARILESVYEGEFRKPCAQELAF